MTPMAADGSAGPWMAGSNAAAVLSRAAEWLVAGKAVALATVVRTWGASPRPVGSHLAADADGGFFGSVSGGCVEGDVVKAALGVLAGGGPRLLDFGVSDAQARDAGLACGGRLQVHVARVATPTLPEAILAALAAGRTVAMLTRLRDGACCVLDDEAIVGELSLDATQRTAVARRMAAGGTGLLTCDDGLFLRVYAPPPRLLVVGAVHIAQALAPMAALAGYAVTVIDPRPPFASAQRFPGIALIHGSPGATVEDLRPDRMTAVVTLSHDPNLDDPALVAALDSPAFYVGALGSRRSHARRLDRLRAEGVAETALARIHAPVGLAIGGRQPAEIAVSVLAQMQQARYRPARPPRVAALVLAAGQSRRMGEDNKLLRDVRGKPLLCHAADAALASRCTHTLVVSGHQAEAVEAALGDRAVALVRNAEHATGMASSLRHGLRALPRGLDGVVVLLGDMPGITGAHIDRLLDAFDPAAPAIVAPCRGGRRGNPVLWPARHFAAIMALSGDQGARGLLDRHRDDQVLVDFDDDAIFDDVDTPEQLAALAR